MNKWNWNNIIVIAAVVIVCAGSYFTSFYWLDEIDRTKINKITIIGTLVTIGALFLTIREQYNLKTISKSIQRNTQEIEEKLINKAFQWNIEKCLKDISVIKEAIKNDKDVRRLNDRLEDLSECLTECKKVIKVHKNVISARCLDKLKMLPDKRLTRESIIKIIDEIGEKCRLELLGQFDSFFITLRYQLWLIIY